METCSCSTVNHALHKVVRDGDVFTITGSVSVEAGYAPSTLTLPLRREGDAVRFNQLRGIVWDEDCSIYVNDHENNCVRQVAQRAK